MNQEAIGIAGVGMVGGALQRYLQDQGHELHLFDPQKGFELEDELNKAGIVFLCVPTPYVKDKGFDLSYVENVISKLEGGKTIVIKSTVIPGTTEKLQAKYPQYKFLFNPEFLSESTADEDMRRPDRQIVGYTKESRELAEKIMNVLPDAPVKKIMPATEAEMVKYFNNTFNAVKVVFANQIYDLCQKLGIDYDNVAETAAASKFIQTKAHLDVFHGGYRGYGGKCLVKDIRALMQFAESLEVDLKLHKVAEEINNMLMREQHIEDPETFSGKKSTNLSYTHEL